MCTPQLVSSSKGPVKPQWAPVRHSMGLQTNRRLADSSPAERHALALSQHWTGELTGLLHEDEDIQVQTSSNTAKRGEGPEGEETGREK